MSVRSEPPPPYSLVAAIFLGLVFTLGAAGRNLYFQTPMLENGDVAVNALQIEHAREFAELYGNYSRFEFNHPGPAFFYAYAAGEQLLYRWLHVAPSPANAHLFTSMCLQSAFFCLGLALIAAHVPWRGWLPVALLAAAIYFGALHDAFMSIWPPHVLLMPFFCFLTACSSVATGRIGHLPAATLAGGFLFHGHVAQPLFVGLLGSACLLWGAWNARRDQAVPIWSRVLRAHARPLAISASLGFVFLVPLFIDIFAFGTRGNVATILGRFYANTGDSKGLMLSLLYFASFATPSRSQDEIFTSLGPQVAEFFRTNSGYVIFWITILLATPFLAFVLKARPAPAERRFLLSAHTFIGIAFIGCLLWGKAQAGPMTHFNSYFYYGIYYFGLLLPLLWIDRAFDRRLYPALSGAVFVIAAVIATHSFQLPELSEADAGLVIKQAVDEAIGSDRSGKAKLLVFEHADWPQVASVALELERHHLDFYAAPWWGFMFGSRHELPIPAEAAPEDRTKVWWITKPGPGGMPLTSELSLFTEPASISPDGDEIRFRGGDNGFRYLVTGLSAGNMDNAWTELPKMALLFAPKATRHDVVVTFDAQSARGGDSGAEAQRGEVYFNGLRIGDVVAKERGALSVVVPQDLWNRQPEAKLEIRFPQAVPKRHYRRPRHMWWTAWGLWAVRFGPSD